MAALRTAIVMTASLSAPVGLVAGVPMVLDGPLETGGPVIAVEEQYERRTLSQLAMAGKRLFHDRCADCHGEGAVGSTKGVNLLQEAFHRNRFSKRDFHDTLRPPVVRQATIVSMPHQFPDLQFNQIERLERYVRELQSPLKFR